MADLTEFVNARVEALNETREVHVGDVQQQLRTIQHRVPPPLNFSLPRIVHHGNYRAPFSVVPPLPVAVLRRYFHLVGLVSTPHKNPRHDLSISAHSPPSPPLNQGTSHSPAYPKTLLIFKRISSFCPSFLFQDFT